MYMVGFGENFGLHNTNTAEGNNGCMMCGGDGVCSKCDNNPYGTCGYCHGSKKCHACSS